MLDHGQYLAALRLAGVCALADEALRYWRAEPHVFWLVRFWGKA